MIVTTRMGKSVYIAEKPSVAQEFAKALKLNVKRKDGYLESEEAIVTWCVGHLVTMSYPEVYDPALKKWSLNTLPFLPKEFQYEVIPAVAKQFQIVSSLFKPERRRYHLCMHRLRERGRIYLPPGRAGGSCLWKAKKTCLDRFPDRGGDSAGGSGGKGSVRI